MTRDSNLPPLVKCRRFAEVMESWILIWVNRSKPSVATVAVPINDDATPNLNWPVSNRQFWWSPCPVCLALWPLCRARSLPVPDRHTEHWQKDWKRSSTKTQNPSNTIVLVFHRDEWRSLELSLGLSSPQQEGFSKKQNNCNQESPCIIIWVSYHLVLSPDSQIEPPLSPLCSVQAGRWTKSHHGSSFDSCGCHRFQEFHTPWKQPFSTVRPLWSTPPLCFSVPSWRLRYHPWVGSETAAKQRLPGNQSWFLWIDRVPFIFKSAFGMGYVSSQEGTNWSASTHLLASQSVSFSQSMSQNDHHARKTLLRQGTQLKS